MTDKDISNKAQEEKDTLRDTRMEIRDLEAELEFMLVREQHEIDYIDYIEDRLKVLYGKLCKLIGKG